jgi:hypothetical protein
MNYQRAFVLGLGDSLRNYNHVPDSGISIGVNDIYKRVKTDYLVCVDLHQAFNSERLTVIKNSKPKCFYTLQGEEFNCWKGCFDNIKQLKAASPRGSSKELDDKEKAIISICSPFTACGVAYHLGAKEIIMYGVDLLNHKTLSEERKVKMIIEHFIKLKYELAKRDCKLYIGSKETALYGHIPFKLD